MVVGLEKKAVTGQLDGSPYSGKQAVAKIAFSQYLASYFVNRKRDKKKLAFERGPSRGHFSFLECSAPHRFGLQLEILGDISERHQTVICTLSPLFSCFLSYFILRTRTRLCHLTASAGTRGDYKRYSFYSQHNANKERLYSRTTLISVFFNFIPG